MRCILNLPSFVPFDKTSATLAYARLSITLIDPQIPLSSMNGRTLSLQFDDGPAILAGVVPLQEACDDPIEHSGAHTPLAKSFQLQPDGYFPEGSTPLIIKVPHLQGRVIASSSSDSAVDPDTQPFLDLCREMFTQEYALPDRFPKKPDSLPWLLYGHRCNATLETSAPSISVSEGMSIPCVIRQKIPGLSLRRWLHQHRLSFDGRFHGLESQEEWINIANALFEHIGELHVERATHGFIYPGNIIVPHNFSPDKPISSLWFINAAERSREIFFANIPEDRPDLTAFSIRRSYDPAETTYAFAGFDSKKRARFALEDGFSYYSSTDIFSIGVTLAYLATGIEDIYKIVRPYECLEAWPPVTGWQRIRGRRALFSYHQMKSTVFASLMEAESRRAGMTKVVEPKRSYRRAIEMGEVILQCARSKENRRALTTEHAQNVLHLFNARPAITDISLSAESLSVAQTLIDSHFMSQEGRELYSGRLASSILDIVAPDYQSHTLPILRNLLSRRLDATLQRIAALHCTPDKRRPWLRVVGSRATLTDAFLVTLSSLTPAYECIAITTANTWSRENFGPTSRISSMIQLCRIAGCRFTWLIALSPEELFQPDVQRILAYRATDDLTLASFATQHGEIHDAYYYACLAEDEYSDLLIGRKTFIGIRKSDSPIDGRLDLQIAPDFTGRRGRLVALTYWTEPRRSARLTNTFTRYLPIMQPLRNFERLL